MVYSGAKEVLVLVKSPITVGVVVSAKRVNDIFKEIHDQFVNTEAPRLGWVIGTEDIESKKKPELKGENNGTKGGVQKHLKQDPIIHSKNSRQF